MRMEGKRLTEDEAILVDRACTERPVNDGSTARRRKLVSFHSAIKGSLGDLGVYDPPSSPPPLGEKDRTPVTNRPLWVGH